jgi:hypothetical protein
MEPWNILIPCPHPFPTACTDWRASWCATCSLTAVTLSPSVSPFASSSPPWTVVSRHVGATQSTPESTCSTLSSMLERLNRPLLHRDPSHPHLEQPRLHMNGLVPDSSTQPSNVENSNSASEQANSNVEHVAAGVDRFDSHGEQSRALVDDIDSDGGRCVSRVERVSDGGTQVSSHGADTSAVFRGERAAMDGIDSK